MTAEDRFSKSLKKLDRIIRGRTVRRTLVAAVLISLALNSTAVGLKEFGLYDFEGISVYALLTLISIAFSLLYTIRTNKSLMEELIDIDARLDLNERISTAHECQRLGRRSIFVELLYEDVSRLLDSMKANQIFPKAFSPAHVMIPFLSLVLISLLLFNFSPSGLIRSASEAKILAQIGAEMNRYTKKKMIKGAAGEDKAQDDLYRRMKQMSEELSNRTIGRRELLESLDDLIQELSSESAKLSRTLAADLSLGDAANAPMLEALQDENLDKEELEKLRRKLKDLFGGNLPSSVSQGIASLEQRLEFKALLEEAGEDARDAFFEGDEDSSNGEEVLVVKKSEKNEAVDGQPPKDDKTSSDSQTDNDNTQEQYEGPYEAGDPGLDDESEARRPGMEDDFPFTAGRGKGKDEEKLPSELETSKIPAVQNPGATSPGERFNVYVRSLPKVGRAELDPEEIIRTYSQKVEEVIRREDIPPKFREYIKNYFLSIGLRKEDHGNDGSN